MNAFQEIIKKAAPIMAAVHSLFFYVIILSVIGYYVDKKFKTFPILFLISVRNVAKTKKYFILRWFSPFIKVNFTTSSKSFLL